METYPGAKGHDTFTITKTGHNKYHIHAEYDPAPMGGMKTDADVTK